jgi:YVTN family beta-propeller protein
VCAVTVLGLTAAVTGASLGGPAAAASSLAAVPATTTPAIRHAARLSLLPADHPLSLEVALALRNAQALQARVQGLTEPGSPWYRQFLTPRQTTALYGPTKAQLATVERFLRASGIRIGYVSPQRNFIDARATAGTAERALGVRIWQWRDPVTRQVFYANASDPLLPAPVARLVTSITGLDDYAQPPVPLPMPGPGHSRAHHAARPGASPLTTTCTTSPPGGPPSGSCAAPAGAGNLGYSPAQLQQAYTATQLAGSNLCGPHKCDGTFQDVGIFADGSTWGTAAEAAFEQEYGLTSPATKAVCPAKVACPLPYDPAGSGSEADLDVDMVHAIAPGAQVTFYEVPMSKPYNFEADLMDGLSLDLNADLARVTSVSYGECETDYGKNVITTTLHDEFAMMAAQGQAVFAASGDHGSSCVSVQTFSDGSTTAGSATFTSATADFTSADKGGPITETDKKGAVPAGTTIKAVDSATTVTLSTKAKATASKITFQLFRLKSAVAATPATDPLVTAVGGTNLFLNDDNSYAFEYAWSQSGGGESAYFPRPSWQQGSEMPSTSAYPNRLVPDVAAEATCTAPNCDPIPGDDYGTGIALGCGFATTVSSSVVFADNGGTSCATPIWAATATLYNQYASWALANQLDANVNQQLYNLAVRDHPYSGAITNVTYNPPYTGFLFDPAGACATGPCWNGATGLGSPEVYPMVRDLPRLAVTPAAGPPGTALAVTAKGFLPGETVTAKDASDANAVICSGLAADNGNFSCSGTVPGTASYGGQQIVATGKTSREDGLALFDLVANTGTTYAADYGSGTVTPVDTATGTAGPPITVGTGPTGVAVTPDGATAYVANTSSGTVTPIDTATGTAGTPITVGTEPTGIAVTPDGATVYVANYGSGTVTPIDTATGKAGKPITVGTGPVGVAVTPNGATVYVANSGSGTVTPISTATGKAGKPITVGAEPVGVAVTPNGATVYVANNGSGTVTPVKTATNTAGKPITVGTGPTGVAITPDGATAYVANYDSGTVTPIAIATNAPGAPITVGSSPVGVAITPDGATAYVADYGSDAVTPITTATNTAGPAVAVGTGPLGIATSYDGSSGP